MNLTKAYIHDKIPSLNFQISLWLCGFGLFFVRVYDFLTDGEAVVVGTLEKEKHTNKLKMSDYGFNICKFFSYVLCNIVAVLLGSVATLSIALVVHATNVDSLANFIFSSVLDSVIYDWLYDDVFVAILTLGSVLVITYIVSFRRETDRYLGRFSKLVDWLTVTCVVLCFIIIGLEIVYVSHTLHSNSAEIGNLKLYNIVEIVALLVCGFLQTFSHPEYYMSPPQIP